MSRTKICLVIALLCVGVGYGCGGGGVPVDELDTALVDALCKRLVRCGAVEDTNACSEALGELDTGLIELQHAVAGGTIRYDADAMEECLAAFESASCDETAKDVRLEPEACAEAIRGTIADGGVCLIDEQCTSGACEVGDCSESCCEGACVAAPPEAAIGASCATAVCVDGAFCNEADTCEALLASGATCDFDDECTYGLYCEGPAGTCADAPNRGEPCPDGVCADLGTFCDASETCVGLAKRGEACGQLSRCALPNVCSPESATCVSPPAVGQPCTATCASGAYCDFAADVCAAEKADGQPCLGNRECSSGFCDELTETCGAPQVCL